MSQTHDFIFSCKTAIYSLSVHFPIDASVFFIRLETSHCQRWTTRYQGNIGWKNLNSEDGAHWGKKKSNRYSLFKAKKRGATPASGIQGYPTLASSELQAWPKVPGHSLTLGAPPSPVPSIGSGTEGGFWEKKYRLSIGINIECVHAQLLGRVQLFVTLWTVAHQAPLSMTFFQARILEWVAISYSRGSSQPRDQIWVSYSFLIL